VAIRGASLDITDFSGGLNTSAPEYEVPMNQSPDAQNINLLVKGFKKRQGDAVWNSTAMVSGSTAIQGMGWIQYDSGVESLNAVAGTKYFTDNALSKTMTDKTGTLTITAGQNNIWTPVRFNNQQIWFGGAPDAPFKDTGSGNATVVAGSPPTAQTAFVSNNFVFAVSTTANPSRIFWCVVNNPADWSSAGSGNADIGLSDGEALMCGVPVGPSTVILFKNSSTHLLVSSRQPFPVFQLQKGVGIAGRYAFALVKGTIYFITPWRRMLSTTDGVNFEPYSHDIDDQWDAINSARIPYIQGIYYPVLEQIHWYISNGSSTQNDTCLVWDLIRKSWLKHPKGFKVNVPCLVENRRLFGGQYDGKLYEKDKSTVYTDASETSPGAINAYWRTPFKGYASFQQFIEGSYRTGSQVAPLSGIIHPLWFDFSMLNESATTMTVSYGFDFSTNIQSTGVSLISGASQWDVAQWDVATWGGQTAVIKRIFVSGRGNLFSMTFQNSTASQSFTMQGISVQLRTDKARKLLNVS
jgi:hypothetical protein